MTAAQPLLSLRGICTQFGQQIVHDHLDLDVYRAEIFGLVGGSGSGKSVLLRIMSKLDFPQKGTLIYHGTTPETGMLFQNGALISSLTVLQNIMIPLDEVAHSSPPFAAELAYMKLDLVGLKAEDAHKYPAQLSGGMIKRVGIARAIVLDPQILFLDEPTAGLDPIAAEEVDQLILSLHQRLGITVVLVTHDLDTLASICNRLGVLVDHHIIAGPVNKIVNLDHPWISRYFQGERGKIRFGKIYGS